MFYGFTVFCEDFLKSHPGYFIYPSRLKDSAVETIFSQLKYSTGGNLMSTNYASASASLLIKGCVSGRYKGEDYRIPAHSRSITSSVIMKHETAI